MVPTQLTRPALFAMAGSWPKILRDPVHGLIPFEDSPCDRLLLDLINSREFQRLRRIKQLGMSQYVFPGADHSRFSHSIGVMQTARRILDRTNRCRGEQTSEEHRTIVLAAALIHDVGHGPFSHTFEKITRENHERRTLDIVLDEGTVLGSLLRDHAPVPDLPDRLSTFFDSEPETDGDADRLPGWLTAVVSSQLDADRFDYLRRDSLATGVDFGTFDLDWLIENLRVDDDRDRLFLSRKALSAVERYVFARYHMYRAVYFHKTTRAAEVMLRLLMRRYQELLKEREGDEDAQADVVPNAPPEVRRAFARGGMSLIEYLELDDHSMTAFMKACDGPATADPVLRELGGGLLHRKLFKARDVTHVDASGVADFQSEVAGAIRATNRMEAYSLTKDSASDMPYKPYDPDADNPATQIYVETAGGSPKELTTLSRPVKELTEKYTLLRYYFPEDIRVQIDQIADRVLGAVR
jgi:HD superfamily phosphohydrolase